MYDVARGLWAQTFNEGPRAKHEKLMQASHIKNNCSERVLFARSWTPLPIDG